MRILNMLYNPISQEYVITNSPNPYDCERRTEVRSVQDAVNFLRGIVANKKKFSLRIYKGVSDEDTKLIRDRFKSSGIRLETNLDLPAPADPPRH